jgi:Holliday junction DNA helicase RuvA
MYEYIEGLISELNPSFMVINNQGIGYFVNISLNTYTFLSNEQNERKNQMIKIYIHQIIREDAHLLYGFYDKKEREVFRQLITVSGIGANTARMILSSHTPEQLQEAVANGDVNQLKSIKGIGAKSAQRIIVDLKDKLTKDMLLTDEFFAAQDNTIKEEAFSALVTLGFSKKGVEKVLDNIISQDKNISVEILVKEALKKL